MELHLEVEALVFRYSATIIAGYIWTFLALLAVVISLWRFRLLGSASSLPPSPPAPKSLSSAASPSISPPPPPTSAPMAYILAEESGSSTKGRFTLYFLADEGIDGGDESDECERGGEGACGGGECFDWGSNWRGDLRWYGYQDWKAIDGSVVRLWDGGRRG